MSRSTLLRAFPTIRYTREPDHPQLVVLMQVQVKNLLVYVRSGWGRGGGGATNREETLETAWTVRTIHKCNCRICWESNPGDISGGKTSVLSPRCPLSAIQNLSQARQSLLACDQAALILARFIFFVICLRPPHKIIIKKIQVRSY